MIQEINTSESNMPTAVSVLVVDDDEITQELLAEMLSMMGFKVLHNAKDGRTALKVLADLQSPPKFLICDIFMPNMDAFEFLDQLVMQQYSGGIVLMTGVDPEMMMVARTIAVARGLQILGTILKPVSIEQLTSVLQL